MHNPGRVANATHPGATVIVSIDRIKEAIDNAGLDINDADDREKIILILQAILAHEAGHRAGQCHTTDCRPANEKNKREENDMMYDDGSLANIQYKLWSRDSLDQAVDYWAHQGAK